MTHTHDREKHSSKSEGMIYWLTNQTKNWLTGGMFPCYKYRNLIPRFSSGNEAVYVFQWQLYLIFQQRFFQDLDSFRKEV